MKSRCNHRGRDAGFRAFGSEFPFNDMPHWAERFALERWAMIGHRGGGGGGRFGGGPSDFGGHGGHGGPGDFGGRGGRGGFGEDGMPRGRKFSSDDLQLLLMAMLAEAPRHGYELIKALQDRSNGFYAPSPGMVYPALTYLEELGYATVELEGNRKRYALSDAGRGYLEANRERVDLMLARLAHFAQKMDLVRRAYMGEDVEGNGVDGRWLPELIAARRALKRALLLRTEAGPDEQRRIAEILARATAEIEQQPAPKQEGA